MKKGSGETLGKEEEAVSNQPESENGNCLCCLQNKKKY